MAEPITAAITAVVSYVTTASAAVAAGTATLGQIATTFAVNTAISAGLSAVSSAIFTPRTGQGGSPVAFKADPSAPISGVMGRFGVGGRQLHANVWGKDNLYISFAVALSLGPIQSVEQFTANGNVVTFPGAQGLAAPVEPYKDKMWQTYRLGLPTDAALLPPSGVSNGSPPMSEWTSAHTLPGFAQSFWTMQNNSKRASYESGVPAPIWTLLGMKVWDPRLDSTYPGGSGSQRRDEWDTWAYSDNPYLHALAWVRGHAKLNTDGTVDRTKRLAGVGAPDEAIDIAAFVEGANVADANDWTIAGEWTTADDKWQVLAAMLQAGGGVPLNRGAQISCMVEAPRTSLLTLTGADIVGSVSLNVMASRRDRPNTIVPRVRLEAQKFEEVALGAVTASTYLAEDGGEPRTREVPYRYVGQAKQGAELAAYGLANARETLKASIPCKPHLLGLRAGDAFTVNEPELGLNGQKFVVVKRAFDPSSCIVTLDVRSETDGKHAFALGQVANPPSTPGLTDPDRLFVEPPTSGEWTLTAQRFTANGTAVPALVVVGSVENLNATAVIFEFRPSGVGAEWTPWSEVPPTTLRQEITGLTNGTQYEVAVTYRRGANYSARLVLGPVTAGSSDGTFGPNANRVPLSNFDRGTEGWAVLGDPSGLAAAGGFLNSGTFAGRRFFNFNGTFTALGQTMAIGSDGSSSAYAFRVTPGERLSFSIRLQATGAVAALSTAILWKDAAGVETQEILFTLPGPIAYGTYVAQFVTVPAGAFSARIVQYVDSSGPGLFDNGIIEPMVTSANPGQVEHPPYSAGPIDLTGAVRWIDANGRIVDGRGLPLNASQGAGVIFSPAYMLSAGADPETEIEVAATTATLTGGVVISLPAATISGLSADTPYSIFRDLDVGAYIPLATAATAYIVDPSRYLGLGIRRTAQVGGGYTPPLEPPPGGGGGNGGTLILDPG